jgi:dienelactone hydrolase
VSADPLQVETVDKGDYIREKVIITTAPHTRMPVYLLRPKHGTPPFPLVLAFHGHGYGVKDIVGLWEDGSERDTPDGYHRDFGVALCRQGFAVAAPEISCFGDRRTHFDYLSKSLGQPVPTTCENTAALAVHSGGSVVGLRVRDGLRLVDYLCKLPDLDTGRLGAMGISGGGMHTLFSTCLDERIRTCVISGYYSSFRDSILAMRHCPCNYVPGLAAFGEMSDLIGLVAPRPVFIEAGSHDPIFPIGAVRKAVEEARRVYRVFDAESAVELEVFEGRHRINGVGAYRFLKERLENPTAPTTEPFEP